MIKYILKKKGRKGKKLGRRGVKKMEYAITVEADDDLESNVEQNIRPQTPAENAASVRRFLRIRDTLGGEGKEICYSALAGLLIMEKGFPKNYALLDVKTGKITNVDLTEYE